MAKLGLALFYFFMVVERLGLAFFFNCSEKVRFCLILFFMAVERLGLALVLLCNV